MLSSSCTSGQEHTRSEDQHRMRQIYQQKHPRCACGNPRILLHQYVDTEYVSILNMAEQKSTHNRKKGKAQNVIRLKKKRNGKMEKKSDQKKKKSKKKLGLLTINGMSGGIFHFQGYCCSLLRAGKHFLMQNIYICISRRLRKKIRAAKN